MLDHPVFSARLFELYGAQSVLPDLEGGGYASQT